MTKNTSNSSKGLHLGFGIIAITLLSVQSIGLGYQLGSKGANSVEGLSEIKKIIHDEALEVTDERLIDEGALQGAVDSLGDRYADWYNEAEFEALNQELDSRFVGVGIVMERTMKELLVTSVLPDSPAERAGIEPGSWLVKVGDTVITEDMTLKDVAQYVTGEEGSKVKLSLIHEDKGEYDVTVRREKLNVPLTKSELVDVDGKKVAHITLYEFTRGASKKLREDIERLKDEGAQGVVLDLRNNPGGLLTESIEMVSLFVEKGQTVVTIEDRDHIEDRVSSNSKPPFVDLPLVVLVNEFSASASEIVAGALQDLDRARIVGSRTFGKGVVQNVIPLENGTGMKLTTARYLTPSGDSIDKVGVKPDVKLDVKAEDVVEKAAKLAVE